MLKIGTNTLVNNAGYFLNNLPSLVISTIGMVVSLSVMFVLFYIGGIITGHFFVIGGFIFSVLIGMVNCSFVVMRKNQDVSWSDKTFTVLVTFATFGGGLLGFLQAIKTFHISDNIIAASIFSLIYIGVGYVWVCKKE